MITDTHTSYLAIMLRASETEAAGWRDLLERATATRHPEAILTELRAKIGEVEAKAAGWRDLHDYATARRPLPLEQAAAEAHRLAAEVDSYSTGTRLDELPVGCTCGNLNDPTMVHRRYGLPCYLKKGYVPLGDATSLLDDDPAPTGRQDAPTATPGGKAALTEWTPGQEDHFKAFQGIHAGREQEAPEEYSTEKPPNKLAAFLRPKDGQQ